MMKRCFFLLVGFWLSSVQANTVALKVTAGIDDNFAGAIEQAEPSTVLQQVIDATALADFDQQPVLNANIAHTFSSLSTSGTIVGGVLRFRVRGSTSGSFTDGIVIAFADDANETYLNQIAFKRNFGQFAGGGSVFTDVDEGLLTPGVPWGVGVEQNTELDLSALPLNGGGTINLLPQIQSNGFVDIAVGGDTAVDYFEIELQIAPAENVPVSPLVIMVSAVLFTLITAIGVRFKTE